MLRVQKIVKLNFLIAPSYGYTRDEIHPYKPTIREILIEFIDTLHFLKHPKRVLLFLGFSYHLFTAITFVFLLCNHLSLVLPAFLLAIGYGHTYHTIWLHRYCSHAAFSFSPKGQWLKFFFLWTNPLFLPEQGYVITHYNHHAFADKIGDPHGPQHRWLGSYFAVDAFQKFNTAITEQQYGMMTRRLAHIGFPMNDFLTFQKTGSVEKVPYFLARTVTAQFLWMGIAYGLGGKAAVWLFFAGIFVLSFIFRDFGYRGHGGTSPRPKKAGWEFANNDTSLNHHFYALVASEWHNNHHLYPTSANTGLLKQQYDLSFQLIRFFKKIGWVESINNAQPTFLQNFQGIR